MIPPVGTKVKTKASLNTYADKIGTVVSIHKEKFSNRVHLEIGLAFNREKNPHAWFLPTELESIPTLIPDLPKFNI